jgi:hypothetical protein
MTLVVFSIVVTRGTKLVRDVMGAEGRRGPLMGGAGGMKEGNLSILFRMGIGVPSSTREVLCFAVSLAVLGWALRGERTEGELSW